MSKKSYLSCFSITDLCKPGRNFDQLREMKIVTKENVEYGVVDVEKVMSPPGSLLALEPILF